MNQQHVSGLEGFLSNIRTLEFGLPCSDPQFLIAQEGIPCQLGVSGDSEALSLSPRSSRDDDDEDDWEDDDYDDDDYDEDEDDWEDDDDDEDDYDDDEDDWEDDDYDDDDYDEDED